MIMIPSILPSWNYNISALFVTGENNIFPRALSQPVRKLIGKMGKLGWLWDVAVRAATVNSQVCGKVQLIHFLFVFSTLLKALSLMKVKNVVYLRFSFHRLQFGHIVARDVAFLLCCLGPCEPPITLGIIDNLQVFAFLEAQVLVGPCVVVIQGHKHLDIAGSVLRWVRQWSGTCAMVHGGSPVTMSMQSGQCEARLRSGETGDHDTRDRSIGQSCDAGRGSRSRGVGLRGRGETVTHGHPLLCSGHSRQMVSITPMMSQLSGCGLWSQCSHHITAPLQYYSGNVFLKMVRWNSEYYWLHVYRKNYDNVS